MRRLARGGRRTVAGVVNSIETLEGGGFLVRRPFPKASFSEFDPFLLLDEMGPMELAPGEAKGAPDHPHRGFETVTYLLSGEMEHKDSRGHAGRLRPGDVQWMTAGAGVIHSEMPAREFARDGGRMHGFQLWVNLPKRDKMMKPRYQEIPNSQIPKATSADGLVTVSVIAGEAMGEKAVIETRTPIIYLHYRIKPGGAATQQVPSAYNAFAYVVDGRGIVRSRGRARWRRADGSVRAGRRRSENRKSGGREGYARSVAHRRSALERTSRALRTVCDEHAGGNPSGD